VTQVIRVGSISKSFGRIQAVRRVCFEVPRGQVVGLLGANGAGKTTTIRMVTGFLPPDEGSITVEGHDTVRASEAARRSLGYLPESAPAYAEMGVADYLDFRGRLYGMARAPRRDAVERALHRCDLASVRKRRVGQLSRGYRQRVGLAAAILHDPPVLVLDEPTSALDPRQIRHTRSLIRELARDKAVLVSSHILPEVEQTCDRVVILAGGSVRIDAKPSDLLASVRESSPYVVEARSAPEHLMDTLNSVAGVARVEHAPAEDGSARARVFARPGAPDLRDAIGAALARESIVVRELAREQPSLERIFLQLIESEAPLAPAGAAA
jgi:ABC-2 type transport system ATP-binding protein